MGKTAYTNYRNSTLMARMESDKKYLILRLGSHLLMTAGLGWYILYTLYGIKFALDNEYIPVIDWQNCKIPKYDAEKVGKENVWEYFFEQPCQVDLHTAYASENFFIIDDIGTFSFPDYIHIENMEDFFNSDIEEWRKCFHQYIRFKKEIIEYFDDCLNKQISPDKHLIGVLARGTDYRDLKPVGHFRPIAIDEIFSYLDQWRDELNNSKIFIATEDIAILNRFKEKYPNDVYSVDAKRYSSLGHNTINIASIGENGIERDMKYLYSLYVISKSVACIYSPCGGGALAALMREHMGIHYQFLCHGHNCAKGIIVGSSIEREQGNITYVGNKPIMFYALNTLKLLGVEEVDIIASKRIKTEYHKIIGSGRDFGVRINYILSENYDVMDYILGNPAFMTSSKIVILYADHILHGKDVIKELTEKVNAFDGAYVWGVKNITQEIEESIEIDVKQKIPVKAFKKYGSGNYKLAGRYVFDLELLDIIKMVRSKDENPTIADILNEYINRGKLFFSEYPRGIIYSKICNLETLKKTDKLICLMEDIQKQPIGDFKSFKVMSDIH